MGSEPLLETDPESFVPDLNSPSNCLRSGSKRNFFLWVLNFLLIKVKLKEKCLTLIYFFPSLNMTELNFKFFEFKFSTKFIFLIHRIRIRNSGSGSGFGRGSCPMQIRIHNTAQTCGIVIFHSLAPDTNFFFFSRSGSCFSSGTNSFYLKYFKNTSITQQKP